MGSLGNQIQVHERRDARFERLARPKSDVCNDPSVPAGLQQAFESADERVEHLVAERPTADGKGTRPVTSDDYAALWLELEDGATAAAVVQTLNIPSTEPRLTLINGKHAKDDTELYDGDTLVLLTPVEGG